MTADTAAMLAQIERGDGFIAALDQSGGSTPGALKGYGIGEDRFSGDEEMFALIHAMRERVMTSPCFTGEKVIGAILFERTMDGEAGGKPVPELLWERGVVPFLKVDKGLEEERDGVKLMKPIGGLGELLERAKAKGIFGTKMRSVIERASPTGIAAIVEQQFAVAAEISRHGLMPIIEPEVSIKSPERADCDRMLRDELVKALDALPHGDRVMLKLTIPAEAGFVRPARRPPRRADHRGVPGRLHSLRLAARVRRSLRLPGGKNGLRRVPPRALRGADQCRLRRCARPWIDGGVRHFG